VMAEALACGTPVLGFVRGAVPEVVEHGVSGCVVETLDELVVAVGRLDQLRRMDSRRRVEERYSEVAIAEGYLNVYEQMLMDTARPRPLHR